ncbi:cytochrome-c oxidase [Virgibacillus sp. 179-BFC.A HS]|uniref:Cytochrome-c oxidase n=1 Tax=Tigheibacillus jepli TaxID=3035914 RepID=A0ABU5CF51_9BACI|nr:cytochrome-c oxidase [Virgibacillus sp. 179-BFC.A HS]MDY0404962.1 cytochrome-c oxidase [Virgibacillus sp. 179-BFC.A HS]
MGKTLIKISVIYFAVGVSFGLYMSATHLFELATVHVHLNLLGWVSLAIAGIFYVIFPNLARTKLAHIHFWLHNIGLPIMMLGIAFAILGGGSFLFAVATLGGLITVIGIFCFAINVATNI